MNRDLKERKNEMALQQNQYIEILERLHDIFYQFFKKCIFLEREKDDEEETEKEEDGLTKIDIPRIVSP